MLSVNFYTKEHCLLCEEALTIVEILQSMYSFQINICDIHERDDWLEQYFLLIPVVEINGTKLTGNQLTYPIIEETIKAHL